MFAPLSVVGAVLGLTQTTCGTSSPVSFSPAIGSMIIVLLSSVYMLRYRSPAVDILAPAAGPAVTSGGVLSVELEA